MKADRLKQVVRQKYGAIASQSLILQQQPCCGPEKSCSDFEISLIGDEYTDINGYNKDAD